MGTSKHKCPVCGKVLETNSALRDHCFTKDHYQIRCEFCQKGLINQQAKYEHERMKHAVPATGPAGASTDSAPHTESLTPSTGDSSSVSKAWEAFSMLSESEQERTYSALSHACHGHQLLESQGYILPGSIRADMKEITSLLYVDFRGTPHPSSRLTKTSKRKAVSLHCERVLVLENRPTVALISAVDTLTGDVLLNAYVNPTKKVFDWRTDITGINSSKMRRTVKDKQALNGWQDARDRLFSHIDSNTILVGHELQNSLGVLGIFHPRVVDTAIATAQAAFGENALQFPTMWGLEYISRTLLHQEMGAVDGYRNSLERARVSREIALCIRSEGLLKSWGTQVRIEYHHEQQIKAEEIKQSIGELLAEHRLAKKVKVGILIEGLDS
ncbi:hypothetical protein PISL3812_03382 [Talaromyces islandicus]|uniref:C2H2-type domain-containing protein n=1 Tax=Talaromyces islandicus TaxID=28573 RepID=A0A0U1LUB7_TALIS|nr:hypothetical protein PISL3812_03382 [Talaromyces islandicus]